MIIDHNQKKKRERKEDRLMKRIISAKQRYLEMVEKRKEWTNDKIKTIRPATQQM